MLQIKYKEERGIEMGRGYYFRLSAQRRQKLEYRKRELCDYLIEGSTNSKCKGPVAGACLTGPGNSTDLCIQTSIQKAASEHLLMPPCPLEAMG